MRNNDVLEAFLNKQEATNYRNLHSEKENECMLLINYRTIIAKITEDGILLINSTKYSRTTSTHQNYLKRSNIKYYELYEEDIRKINNFKKDRLRLITAGSMFE